MCNKLDVCGFTKLMSGVRVTEYVPSVVKHRSATAWACQ